MSEPEFAGIAGFVLLILGLIACLVTLFANIIEIGPFSGTPGFGFKQITGAVAGVFCISSGAYLTTKCKTHK
jgi:hypothetical protein